MGVHDVGKGVHIRGNAPYEVRWNFFKLYGIS